MAYDPSKDPLGFDPNNPNTQIINGNLYVWQPSTQGQDAQNYLGANADPSVVNQDTSPASGNGSWVPASYEHPGGQFWSLLAKIVAATSGAEYGLSFLPGLGAAGVAGAGGAGAAGAATPALTTTALGGSLPGLATVGLPSYAAGGLGAAGAAGAGSTIAPLTTTTLSGIPPGFSTVALPAATAGGSSVAKNLIDNAPKNKIGNTAASTLPSWLKPAIAAAAPTLGKLTGGGSSDLTKSLEQALTGLVPDLQHSFQLGMQRQEQASPLYDAVLKMALGRLPNWSTGGGE